MINYFDIHTYLFFSIFRETNTFFERIRNANDQHLQKRGRAYNVKTKFLPRRATSEARRRCV